MPNLLASLRTSRWLAVPGGAVLACLPALAALAEEAAHGESAAHHSSGLPQLDPSVFPTQLFWVAIAFVALYWLMTRRALPVVEQVLEERAQRIAQDLDEAQQQKDKAAALQAEVEKAMAVARGKAQADVAGIVAAADQAARERHARQAADIAARVTDAEKRLTAAKAEAVANVSASVSDLSRDIVTKLAGVASGEPEVATAVAAAIRERG
jgi:F-type H+-transporting ATPase subunit b